MAGVLKCQQAQGAGYAQQLGQIRGLHFGVEQQATIGGESPLVQAAYATAAGQTELLGADQSGICQLQVR